MLVYIFPLVLTLLGYVSAYLAGGGEGACVAAAFSGLFLGAALMVLSQRLKKDKGKEISFEIVKLVETGEQK